MNSETAMVHDIYERIIILLYYGFKANYNVLQSENSLTKYHSSAFIFNRITYRQYNYYFNVNSNGIIFQIDITIIFQYEK